MVYIPPEVAIGLAKGAGDLIGGIFGASSQKDAERDARRNANQSRIQTFNAQVADWQYNQAQQQINYNFAVASAKLSAQIGRAVATQDWQTQKALSRGSWITQSTNLRIENLAVNAQNQRDVDYQRTLQAADYRTQTRLFEQSERTYSENTRLIADAARQGFQYEKAKLAFERLGFDLQRQQTYQQGGATKGALALERQGIALQRDEAFTRFDATKKQARNQAKQIESRYKQQLTEAGLSGEALQGEVKRLMQEYTAQVDRGRREASKESAEAQATGRSGASVNRVAADPFNQNNFAIGSLGVELGFFGQQKQLEMMKLVSQTNLAGVLADSERQQLYDQVRVDELLTNLGLKGLNLAERRAIFEANNNIDTLNSNLQGLNLNERRSIFETNNALDDIQLEGRSLMNQAESARLLRPLDPVKILDPLQVPMSFLPSPMNIPKPLAARNAATRPFLPGKPLGAPAPVLGSQAFSSASAAPGILIGGITNAATSFASAWKSNTQQ